jgi:hypothetical protein
VGYQYDPDGFNYAGGATNAATGQFNSAKGHLYLTWTDAQGEAHTRYYDGLGRREDGSGEDLYKDFMKLALGGAVGGSVLLRCLAANDRCYSLRA